MKLSDYVHFCEHHFPPVSSCAHEYFQKVSLGYDRMRNSSVVIAGLARSIASVLPATLVRLELLRQAFADAQILIYENDSDDETPEMLAEWARRSSHVCVVSESLGAPASLPIRCSERADRMAHYRSRCQKIIRERFSAAQHVILIDTDLEGGWSTDGIASTFGNDDWDFVGSNGIMYKRIGMSANATVHYDAWAYRETLDFKPLSTKIVNRIQFHRGEPLVPLPSCFGGLGIYRMDAYLAGDYCGGDIEHASFHRSMRQRGFDRTFLNPSQLVVYGRKNRRWDWWLKRLQRVSQALHIHRRIPWRYENKIDFRVRQPMRGDEFLTERAA